MFRPYFTKIPHKYILTFKLIHLVSTHISLCFDNISKNLACVFHAGSFYAIFHVQWGSYARLYANRSKPLNKTRFMN